MPTKSLRTLISRYCAANQCTEEEFTHKVFWECLYRRAIPFAFALRILKRDYFAADREFLADAGRALDMAQIRRETVEYSFDPRNRGCLRRTLKIRVSAGRLVKLAEKYLSATEPASPGDPY